MIPKDYEIQSEPTMSVGDFQSALIHRMSPVAKYALESWDICVRHGINPAVALATFIHESNAGNQGIATETLNWGNLRSGPGEYKNENGFAYYASFLISLNDYCLLMKGSLYAGSGLKTVSQITPRYAPSADNNDPSGYAYAVNSMCQQWETMYEQEKKE